MRPSLAAIFKEADDWCSIFVPTVDFASGSDRDEPSLASEKVTSRITRPNRQTANRFRASVLELMSIAAKYPQFESSLASTVADVLLQHGEWQFGRFAARYRRLFGELPSETLQARPPIVQVPSCLAIRSVSLNQNEWFS